MSDVRTSDGVARADDVEEQAAAWLRRRHFSTWNGERQNELDAWFAQSLAHRVAFVRLEAAWKRAERLAALRVTTPEQSERSRMKFVSFGAFAALVLAAMIGAGVAWFLPNANEKSYATVLGGRQTVQLADGTRIELNTDTAIRARVTTTGRTIWLDRGEAFFQVKHDAAHPFVVIAGDRRMTDLGTKFLVRRDTEELRVSVMEGSVRFDAGSAQKKATLTSGDVAIATATTMRVTKKPEEKLASELGWRNGLLIFEHTTLADAAAEFNRYNRKKIVIADPETARMTIGGTFQTGNVDLFGRVAQDVLGLRVAGRGDAIVISR